MFIMPCQFIEVLDDGEFKLLATIAEQIAMVAQSFRLASDLQGARQQLVATREEERRRLRRDLHDGLGPALAAQTLIVGSARRLLETNPQQADQLLNQLEKDIQGTLEQVRRLVYSLRPPDLDQLGLVGAIRAKVVELTPGTIGLELVLPEPSIVYPAAVEVAAYRIVTEALTNVVHHAQARSCKIQLKVTEVGVELSISDDGIGFTQEHYGVGMAAMREGGIFSVKSSRLGATSGATLRACRPWWAEGPSVPPGRMSVIPFPTRRTANPVLL